MIDIYHDKCLETCPLILSHEYCWRACRKLERYPPCILTIFSSVLYFNKHHLYFNCLMFYKILPKNLHFLGNSTEFYCFCQFLKTLSDIVSNFLLYYQNINMNFKLYKVFILFPVTDYTESMHILNYFNYPSCSLKSEFKGRRTF